MVMLFVRHKVVDFGKWKVAYDAFNTERGTMGVKAHGVFQAEENPNEVTIYHEFATMDAAKVFVGSARLKEVMESAGVTGAPDMWFTTKA